MKKRKKQAGKIGYPVMLKACAGGGGRGIRLIRSEAELDDAYMQATAEAASRVRGRFRLYWKNIFFRPAISSFKSLQTRREMSFALERETVRFSGAIRS